MRQEGSIFWEILGRKREIVAPASVKQKVGQAGSERLEKEESEEMGIIYWERQQLREGKKKRQVPGLEWPPFSLRGGCGCSFSCSEFLEKGLVRVLVWLGGWGAGRSVTPALEISPS